MRVAKLCYSFRVTEAPSVHSMPADIPAEDSSPAGSPSEGGQPEGLRERKKLATRRALGIAAMRLAVERGLENVLVEDIAARAGVSTRTFNNYFASKYEAICALAMDRGRLIGATLRDRPADEPLWAAITHAVLEQHSPADQAPDKGWTTGVRAVIRSPALQGEFLKSQYVMQHVLAGAIAERTGTDASTDMFPRVIAGAVTAATQVAMERWLFADPPVPLAPLIRLALRALSDGLPAATAPGRTLPAPADETALAAASS
jgi:AcrR family transcriptional regulator